MSRTAMAFAALLTFACAGQTAQQPAPAPAPAEGSGAPPPSPEVQREQEHLTLAAARLKLEEQRAPFNDALAAVTADPKKATSEAFDRARAEIARLEKQLAESKHLESKNVAFGALASELRAAIEKGRAELDARWLEVGFALQKPALDAAVKDANKELRTAKARNATEEAIAKAEAAVKAIPALIARGAMFEPKDPKYAQQVAAVKKELEALEKAVAEARTAVATRLQIEAATKAIDGAKKALTATITAAAQTLEPPALDACDKAATALERALEAGKAFAADKGFAQVAAVAAKELVAKRTAIAALRQQAAIKADRAKVDTLVAAVDAKIAAITTADVLGGLAAVEKAAADLEKGLKDAEPLGAKDKAYAAVLAATAKKVADARAVVARTKGEQSIAAHRIEVAAEQAKVDETLKSLEGKLEWELYQRAEGVIEKLGTVVAAGASFAAADAKYAAELKALGAKVPAYRMQMRRIWIDAASAQAAARMKALEGKPDAAAFTEAEKAIEALAKIVESAKTFNAPDKAYLGFVAGAEKQVPQLRAQIEARKIGLKVEAHRAQVETLAAAAAERMKALEGEPADAAFGQAEAALAELERALAPSEYELAKSDRANQAFLAEQKKKLDADKKRIAARRIEVVVGGHRKKIEAAAGLVAEQLKALAAGPTDAAIAASNEAVSALEAVVASGGPAAQVEPKYQKELDLAKGRVAQQRAEIERRRLEGEVQAFRAKVGEAVGRVNEALGGLAATADPSAVEQAVRALEAVLAEGKTLAEKDKGLAKVVAVEQGKIAGYGARVTARRLELEVEKHQQGVEAAEKALDERLGALAAEATAAALKDVESAAALVEKAVASGEELSKKSAPYAKRLALSTKKVADARARLAQRGVELEVQAHRQKVQAAESVVREKLEAVTGKLEYDLYKKAEEAISSFGAAIESGEELKAKDKAYARELAAAAAGVEAHRIEMRKRWIEAAEAAVVERSKALEAKPNDKAFTDAEEAVGALEKIIESGKSLTKSAPYQKMVAGFEAGAKKHRAFIAKRRVEVVVEAHRPGLESAAGAVSEKLAAIKAARAEPSAFEAAEAAVKALEESIAAGDEAASKDPAYAKRLASLKGQIEGHRSTIERRRVETELGAHREKVRAAAKAVGERLAALDGDEGLASAEEAIGALESAITGGEALAEKSPAYKKELAVERGKIGGYRGRIAAKRVEVEASAHRTEVETKIADAEKRIGALSEGTTPAALKSAEAAVKELEDEIASGAETAKKSAPHAKWLAAASKRAPAFREAIGKKAVETEVAAHREKLAAADAKVRERLEAVAGKLEYELYKNAEAAVSSLEKLIDEGSELGERDKAYARELAALRGTIEGHRIDMRRRWIEAAEGAAVEKVTALQGKADDRAFEAAEEAVEGLEKIIESGKSLTKNAQYQKMIAASEAGAKRHRGAIAKRRVEIVVEAHRTDLDAAESAVAEKIGALEGKAEPAAFGAAESAVKTLADTIESGGEAASKDPAYARRLAKLKASIDARRATIEKKRFEAEVSGHREKVAAAVRTVAERLGALGEPASFDAAEEAIGSLESALGEGKSFADRNQAYAKAMAAERGKIGGYRARIAKKRVEAEMAEHLSALAEAQSEVGEKIGALKGAEPSAFEEAAKAVTELEEAIGEGARFAKSDKGHAKKLAALSKEIPRHRGAIEAARLAGEVSRHRAAVESAAGEAERAIGALDGESGAAGLKAAETAVRELEDAIKSGGALAKKSAGHAKWLAGYPKRIAGLRDAIGRKAVESKVIAHRAELEAAEAQVRARLEALVGKLEYELYQKAESAIGELEKAIDEGAALAEKDRSYGKDLAAARSSILRHRITMRRSWVDAAEGAVERALEEGTGDKAEEAIGSLKKIIESGRPLTKEKEYQAFLAAAEKRAKRHGADLERRRSEAEFGAVRAELEKATMDASSRMANAEAEPDAALSALDALATAIDSNEGAAARDPKHAKRLAALKKKVAADRAKIARLGAAVKTREEQAKVSEALSGLSSAMRGLAAGADAGAVEAAEGAAGELESALSSYEPGDKKAKAFVAGARKKLGSARASIRVKRGEVVVAEHRQKLEAQLGTAREAIAGLKTDKGREALANAERQVDNVLELLASGKEVARKDKKYEKFLAAARKTTKQYQAAIAKSRAPVSEPDEDEGEAAAVSRKEDPKAKLLAAQAALRDRLKSLGKKPDEDALSSARSALDDLSGALAEAKKSKPLAKKVAAARVELKKGKALVAKLEAAAAKAAARAEAKAAKAAKLAKAAEAAEEPSGEEEPAAEAGADPKSRVAEAWAEFARQTKALSKIKKKKKKITSEAIERALEAAGEVESALEEGKRSPLAKTAGYKKYASGIRKKLKIERAKLVKQKRATQSARVPDEPPASRLARAQL